MADRVDKTGSPLEFSGDQAARRDEHAPSPPSSTRALVAELAAVVGARLVAVAVVLGTGFRAISDDDYARTVIAQRLVVTPRLDPSGTSWLPFPFHALGAAMAVFGRSLEVARGASVLFALLAGLALHVALVAWEVPRLARLAAMAAVALLPWTLWTTAATVPEACTAALCAAGVLFAALPGARATHKTQLAAAIVVCVATLSRYEAWPTALVVAGLLVDGGWREPATAKRATAIGAALFAIAGAVAWMAWNKATHGSATHFLFRVARFKRALGGPEVPLGVRLGAYPWLLATRFPEALLALVILGATLRRADPLRRARIAALVSAAAVLAFLVYGAVNDGVPTHHSERALLGLVMTIVPIAAASVAHRGTARVWLVAIAAIVALEVGHVATSEAPGAGEADRAAQIARGRALRATPSLTVTPCAYEHFALIAAYGRPEHVTIGPPLASPVGPCPRVAEEPP